MKIAHIDSYVVDAGWRPWIFVVVEADNGLKGYGECSDGRNPWGVVGTIEDFKPLPNVRIMEIDIDDVPWKDALVTRQPQLEKGYMKTPTGPGWGTELVEAEIKKHLWKDKKSSW